MSQRRAPAQGKSPQRPSRSGLGDGSPLGAGDQSGVLGQDAGRVARRWKLPPRTAAIQFGRLDHTKTTNVQWRNEPRHYGVLSDLGTQPKTVYLAKIWNPKPDYER